MGLKGLVFTKGIVSLRACLGLIGYGKGSGF